LLFRNATCTAYAAANEVIATIKDLLKVNPLAKAGLASAVEKQRCLEL
jgi:hypothetical protein